jgi:hypothetical protein
VLAPPISPNFQSKEAGPGLPRSANADYDWASSVEQAEGGRQVPTTYSPGDIVPKNGVVECTQYHGTRDRVVAGTRFAPCDHWGDHHPKKCTWQYV